jgi:ubiquitin
MSLLDANQERNSTNQFSGQNSHLTSLTKTIPHQKNPNDLLSNEAVNLNEIIMNDSPPPSVSPASKNIDNNPLATSLSTQNRSFELSENSDSTRFVNHALEQNQQEASLAQRVNSTDNNSEKVNDFEQITSNIAIDLASVQPMEELEPSLVERLICFPTNADDEEMPESPNEIEPTSAVEMPLEESPCTLYESPQIVIEYPQANRTRSFSETVLYNNNEAIRFSVCRSIIKGNGIIIKATRKKEVKSKINNCPNPINSGEISNTTKIIQTITSIPTSNIIQVDIPSKPLRPENPVIPTEKVTPATKTAQVKAAIKTGRKKSLKIKDIHPEAQPIPIHNDLNSSQIQPIQNENPVISTNLIEKVTPTAKTAEVRATDKTDQNKSLKLKNIQPKAQPIPIHNNLNPTHSNTIQSENPVIPANPVEKVTPTAKTAEVRATDKTDQNKSLKLKNIHPKARPIPIQNNLNASHINTIQSESQVIPANPIEKVPIIKTDENKSLKKKIEAIPTNNIIEYNPKQKSNVNLDCEPNSCSETDDYIKLTLKLHGIKKSTVKLTRLTAEQMNGSNVVKSVVSTKAIKRKKTRKRSTKNAFLH